MKSIMLKFKRRIILIDRPFQLHFCLYSCTWMFALCAVAPIVAAKTFSFLIRDLSLSLSGLELIVVEEMRQRVLVILLCFQGMALLLSFLFCLYLSHRIAGPIYRLKQTLNSVREGNAPDRVKLRKNDYFPDLEETLNLTLTHLRDRSSLYAKTLTHVEAQISKALPHATPQVRTDLENALSAIRESRTGPSAQA